MTTGPETGGYHQFRPGLERAPGRGRLGASAEEPAAGSVDNIERLTDGTDAIQLGIIQSGTEQLVERRQRDRLEGLAHAVHEPLWLFQRTDTGIRRLTDLVGRRYQWVARAVVPGQ